MKCPQPLWALLSLSLLTVSTTQAIGATFVADKACPLYQSKNKLTNPGSLNSTPGTAYPVIQSLGPATAPEWIRVTTSASTSPERWVAADCGSVQLEDGANGQNQLNKSHIDPGSATSDSANKEHCSLPAQQDSHILALSWQGAFCQLHGKGKGECQALSRSGNDPRWLQLTLHGLWPNKRSCGTEYGFCATVKHKAKGFCNYPKVSLSAEASNKLADVMPSAEFDTCLDRHQWWKHGSCQRLDASAYFIEAARLTTQVNQSRMAEALRASSGQKQATRTLRTLFMEEFGKETAKRISFHCSRGMLTEIRISLPAELDTSMSLAQLLNAPSEALRDSCPAQFNVAKPGR